MLRIGGFIKVFWYIYYFYSFNHIFFSFGPNIMFLGAF